MTEVLDPSQRQGVRPVPGPIILLCQFVSPFCIIPNSTITSTTTTTVTSTKTVTSSTSSPTSSSNSNSGSTSSTINTSTSLSTIYVISPTTFTKTKTKTTTTTVTSTKTSTTTVFVIGKPHRTVKPEDDVSPSYLDIKPDSVHEPLQISMVSMNETENKDYLESTIVLELDSTENLYFEE
jgi:hypothetical protein